MPMQCGMSLQLSFRFFYFGFLTFSVGFVCFFRQNAEKRRKIISFCQTMQIIYA